jgi:hypothetical protein
MLLSSFWVLRMRRLLGQHSFFNDFKT